METSRRRKADHGDLSAQIAVTVFAVCYHGSRPPNPPRKRVLAGSVPWP